MCVWARECVFACKRQRLSATQLGRGPQTPILAYAHVPSHEHGRVVTLADRRPHSLRPPSGLHQSVLLFNNGQDTYGLYTLTHTRRTQFKVEQHSL